ncbi:MAG: BadF/BadG/BcrA/BcrD ATPase family protein [Caulobacteraceae bacterium]
MASSPEPTEAMSEHLFLGVDGGGSRCRARLETADGCVLGRGLSGPASMRFGFETARYAIMAATLQALREAGLPEDALKHVYAGIGLAGTGRPGAREALETWRHPFAGAWFEGDAYVALLGAFGGEEGGIVIAGTGSIGVTYQDKTVRVGGYGFPVSDEGSGADIGLNALRHALRTLDGRAEPSAFSEEVLAMFGEDRAEVSDWAERASATDYATLAPIVIRHASAGDAAARRLMQQAGMQIAELVQALLAKGAPQVALTGGLAAILKDYLPPAIAAQLASPQADAMTGGILLAKKRSSEATTPR